MLVWRIFQVGLRQVRRDGMLLLLLPLPLVVALLLRWGVPLLPWDLAAYEGLIDGLLLSLTPLLLAMCCAFLLLDERDEGLGHYYRISPAGGGAYLWARLLLPLGFAWFYGFALTLCFGLAGLGWLRLLAASALSSLFSLGLGLLIAGWANNRVEGLALAKLCGLALLGLFAAWSLPLPYRYLAAWLPSYWLGVSLLQGSWWGSWGIGLLLSAAWVWAGWRRFLTRTS